MFKYMSLSACISVWGENETERHRWSIAQQMKYKFTKSEII